MYLKIEQVLFILGKKIAPKKDNPGFDQIHPYSAYDTDSRRSHSLAARVMLSSSLPNIQQWTVILRRKNDS